MANQFYNSDTGVNWSNVADVGIGAAVSGLATGGIGALVGAGTGLIKGFTSNFFNKKSEKRAWQRYLNQMAVEYDYAQRYAENSPSWTVKGLRDAGINPMLAFGAHAPSAPSVGSHSITPSSTDVKGESHFDPMTFKQLESLSLDNAIKSDNLKTQKAVNEVTRLEAEAKASLLRPVNANPLEGDGKSVGVLVPSKSFRALQKGIADDYDLKSERYIRETAEAVMKYGVDVLKLLPFGRRKEILKKIIFDKNPNGPNSGHPPSTAIRNGPSSEPVFQYD